MQLAQQIKMRQSQSLVMTPQLQQAIKLLQMTNLELCQFLENQQSENPFLEIDTKLNNQENKIEEKSQGIKETTSVISDDIKNGNLVSDDPVSSVYTIFLDRIFLNSNSNSSYFFLYTSLSSS